MFQPIENKPDNVLAYTVSGELTKEDYFKLRDQMDEQNKNTDDIRLYLEFLNWEGITLRALLEDMKTTFEYYNDIKKMAIVGTKGWQEKTTELGDVITPGIKMEFFNTDERESAFEWLK